jgi:sialate O-acetylesterase
MICTKNSRLRVLVFALLFSLAFGSISSLNANVRVHSLISNGAVLQQKEILPIWGWADDGEKVTVKFQGQTVSTIAKDGKWKVFSKTVKSWRSIFNGDNR